MARPKKIRGGVYWRADCSCYWFNYYDASGKRKPMSAETTDLAEAIARWHATDIEARAEERFTGADGKATGPVTSARYVGPWEQERAARGVGSAAKDATRIRTHALPHIGDKPLSRVTREDLITMVRALSAAKDPETGEPVLAPKTVRHVYDAVRSMFADAVIAGLITGTPCTLREQRKELPSKLPDRKKMKRAVFAVEEVEMLLSSDKVPFKRRVHYAFALFTGMRPGEVAARRIRDYDKAAEPLGRIVVDSSWSFERLLEKETKNGRDREVPVHPVLARMLADWIGHGWEEEQGRKPNLDDLLFPAPPTSRFRERRANHFSTQESLELFHADLDALGYRRRRIYDLKRTFITLARRKSLKEHVRWITHAPPTEIIDQYTSPEFPVMCEVVRKLEVSLRTGDVVRLFSSGEK